MTKATAELAELAETIMDKNLGVLGGFCGGATDIRSWPAGRLLRCARNDGFGQ